MTWALADPDNTLLVHFEDGSAIFNPSRWETHVVDPVVGAMVESLRTHPSNADLITLVAAESQMDVAQSEAFVHDAIDQLNDLGLIRLLDAHRSTAG